MRVLWTHNFDPNLAHAGGFMHTLAEGLRNTGVRLDLMYLEGLANPYRLLRARSDVRARSSRYDLVHAQFGSACALATTNTVVPAIVSLRGSDWHRYSGPHSGEARHAWLAYLFTRLSLGAFDRIVTMSARMTAEVARAVPGCSATTITDPIDTTLFRPHDRQASRRQLFDSDSRDPWVLFTTLSTGNPVKRVELAHEAVRLAAQRVPGLTLKVASGIPHQQMPLFVSACDVALCTSTHEGWPNSIKEALACGVPFVSTDVSDLSAISSRHPSCFVAESDPQSLADRLCAALACPQDDGLREEVESMELSAVCKRLCKLYQEVLALHPVQS